VLSELIVVGRPPQMDLWAFRLIMRDYKYCFLQPKQDIMTLAGKQKSIKTASLIFIES